MPTIELEFTRDAANLIEIDINSGREGEPEEPEDGPPFMHVGYLGAPTGGAGLAVREIGLTIGTSEDGVTITRFGPSDYLYEDAEYGVRDATICKVGSTYVIAYGNEEGPPFLLHLAKSTDKLTWTKIGTIDMAASAFDRNPATTNVSACCWPSDGTTHHLVIMADDGSSRDHWVFHPLNSNPNTWANLSNWSTFTRITTEDGPTQNGNFYVTWDAGSGLYYALSNLAGQTQHKIYTSATEAGPYAFLANGPTGGEEGDIWDGVGDGDGIRVIRDEEGLNPVIHVFISNGQPGGARHFHWESGDNAANWSEPVENIFDGFDGEVCWLPVCPFI